MVWCPLGTNMKHWQISEYKGVFLYDNGLKWGLGNNTYISCDARENILNEICNVFTTDTLVPFDIDHHKIYAQKLTKMPKDVFLI